MKKYHFLLSTLLALLLHQNMQAQLHVAGFGATQGLLQNTDVELDSKLTGGNFSIETPLGGYSFRFDLTYLTRLGDKPAKPSLDKMFNIRLGYGILVGEGKRFQIPLFGHASINSSQGDLQLKHWGVGARGGMRFFLTQKVSLYADASADYLFAKDVHYFNDQGVEQVMNLNPVNLQFNVGIMFMYLKKK